MTPGIDFPANYCAGPIEHSIMSGASTFDPICMQPLTSPLGGNYIARLNRFCGAQEGAMMTKQIDVNPTNYIIYVAYMVVLETPSIHAVADQPYFKYDVLDNSGSVIPNNRYSSLDTSGLFTEYITTSTTIYRNWTLDTINVMPYMGQYVTLRFIAAGCPQGAHSAYAYIDASLTSSVTHITQINKDTIQLYPNPTSESLYLSLSANDNLNYEITDLLGRVIIKKEYLVSNTINVSSLNKGTYILKGELNGNFIAQKFIKN